MDGPQLRTLLTFPIKVLLSKLIFSFNKEVLESIVRLLIQGVCDMWFENQSHAKFSCLLKLLCEAFQQPYSSTTAVV